MKTLRARDRVWVDVTDRVLKDYRDSARAALNRGDLVPLPTREQRRALQGERIFEKQSPRQTNPTSTSRHTAKFDRCVKSVKRRLKGVSNPYAVCMQALGKKALTKRR